jgi:hypothetical protein
MSVVDAKSLPPSLLTEVEAAVWPAIQTKLAPLVWGWFGNHRDDKVTKLFGVYTVTVSSFGLVEYALTEIFGPKPVAPAA